MRVIVMSDTHRNYYYMRAIMRRNQNADLFVHLGDGAHEVQTAKSEFPGCVLEGVRGNCDFASSLPEVAKVTLDQAHILMTHGHLFGVKQDLNQLYEEGRRQGANVLLFGHTHLPVTQYREGIYLMNPGSLGEPRGQRPSYGVVDITSAGIVCNIVYIPPAWMFGKEE